MRLAPRLRRMHIVRLQLDFCSKWTVQGIGRKLWKPLVHMNLFLLEMPFPTWNTMRQSQLFQSLE